MKSKLHRATVTRADLDYEGSCSIDPALMRAADIVVGEQVHIVNVNNGSRAITYAIEGQPEEIGLNGAMAHLGAAGDVVIIITYVALSAEELAEFVPQVILLDAANRPRAAAASGAPA